MKLTAFILFAFCAAAAGAEIPAAGDAAAPGEQEELSAGATSVFLADIAPLAAGAAGSPEAPGKTEKTVNAWLMGGRSFAPDSKSWTGSASLLAATVFHPGERWEFLPLYSGYYQLTSQSYELAGGPVLVQHRMDNRVSARLIYNPPASRQRWKLNAGDTVAFLKESKDERLGDGLFDYRIPTGGLEWEYFYRKGYAFRAGYDYYLVTFPNYLSLAGQGPNPNVLELRGTRVLDSRSHSVSAGINGPLERFDGMWDISYALTHKRYPEQPLVNSSGQLRGGRRLDYIHSVVFNSRAEGSFSWPPRVVGGLDATGMWFDSNQNHFDVYENRYIADYYSYGELRLAPYATAYLKGGGATEIPVRLSLSAEWSSRFYSHRPVQSASGGYGAKRLRVQRLVLDTTLTWPLAKRVSARGMYRLYVDSSNMEYKGFYSYNSTQHELSAGLGYEF